MEYMFYPMSTNPQSAVHGWDFLKANLDAISAKLGSGMDALGPLISQVVTPLAREDFMEDIKQFFKDKDTKAFNQKLKQALDAMAVRLEWVRRDGDDVEDWLKSKGYMS
jgi:aminopeptidase 2